MQPINFLDLPKKVFIPIANRIQYRHYVHELNRQCMYLIKSFIREFFLENFFFKATCIEWNFIQTERVVQKVRPIVGTPLHTNTYF